MKKVYQFTLIFFIVLFLTGITTSLCFASSELDTKLDDLVTRITSAMDENAKKNLESGKIRVAVMDFQDLEGKVTGLGRFIAEELTTRLFETKQFEVIERQLLDKVLQELKLGASGFVDADSAQELGKILGVSAIISGTITDLSDNVKVNARLIATNTGAIFSAAAVQFGKNEAVGNLLNKVISIPEGPTGFISEPGQLSDSSLKETELVSPEGEGQANYNEQKDIDITEMKDDAFNWRRENLLEQENHYKNLIEISLSKKDYIGTFTLCQEAISLLPQFAFAYAALGYSYLNIQPPDLESAIAALEQAISLEEYPLGDGYTYYLLGRLYKGKGDLAKARSTLEKGIKRFKIINNEARGNNWYKDATRICAGLYEEEIRSLLQREDYEQTLFLSKQAISSVDAPFAYVSMGYSLLKLNLANAGEAVNLLSQGTKLEEYPAWDGWAYYVLGWAYLEQGAIEEAKQALEKGVIRCKNIYLSVKPNWYEDSIRWLEGIYTKKIQVYLEKEEYSQLITVSEAAVEILDDFAYGYVVLSFSYMKTGVERPNRVISLLRRALSLKEYPAENGWAHYILGWAYQKNADYYSAKDSLSKAVHRVEELGLKPEEIDWFKPCIGLLEESYRRIFSRLLSHGDYQKLLMLANESLQLIPEFAYAYGIKGYCLTKLTPEQNKEAIELLEHAVSLIEYPAGDGWTYYALGLAYKEKGDKKKALACAEKAIHRCEQVNHHPIKVYWYKQCTALLKQLRTLYINDFGMSVTGHEFQAEPYMVIECGSGKGIPLEYYTGSRFRIGYSEDIILAGIGGELVWEEKIFSENNFIGWFTAVGGGLYGKYTSWDENLKLGCYFSLGGGIRIYLNPEKGWRLTMGMEYRSKPQDFNKLSLLATIGFPVAK
jgi:tetratricopeptide (TPR) repeat protein/TolB-like protein